VYLPYLQVDSGSLIGYTPKDLAVHCACTTATLMPEIRRIVHDVDPLQPLSDERTLGDLVTSQTASRAAQLRVLIILAAIALVLSGVGIHGLLSFTVSSRTREIGVRMALGAEASRVRRMVLRDGVLLALSGIVPGAALAYVAGRAMEALLVGVTPGDTATFASALALCMATTLLGCLRPAMRASSVDPATAMRGE
jgi:ABC-type antimicrobial peptide transport system permease subunit